MLEYDRIDVSEGSDINNTNEKGCNICHYLYIFARILNMNYIFTMIVMI